MVQRQMRHSDSRITLQKYAHVIGDAQRRVGAVGIEITSLIDKSFQNILVIYDVPEREHFRLPNA